MTTLLKTALSAAFLGAAAAVIAQRKFGRRRGTSGLGRKPAGSRSRTVEELIGESENREWGGGSAGLHS